jgi:hypothetical protein
MDQGLAFQYTRGVSVYGVREPQLTDINIYAPFYGYLHAYITAATTTLSKHFITPTGETIMSSVRPSINLSPSAKTGYR